MASLLLRFKITYCFLNYQIAEAYLLYRSHELWPESFVSCWRCTSNSAGNPDLFMLLYLNCSNADEQCQTSPLKRWGHEWCLYWLCTGQRSQHDQSTRTDASNGWTPTSCFNLRNHARRFCWPGLDFLWIQAALVDKTLCYPTAVWTFCWEIGTKCYRDLEQIALSSSCGLRTKQVSFDHIRDSVKVLQGSFHSLEILSHMVSPQFSYFVLGEENLGHCLIRMALFQALCRHWSSKACGHICLKMPVRFK